MPAYLRGEELWPATRGLLLLLWLGCAGALPHEAPAHVRGAGHSAGPALDRQLEHIGLSKERREAIEWKRCQGHGM